MKATKENWMKIERMKQLKQKLCETDYKAIKFAEGVLTLAEYYDTKMERQRIREEIRELEKQLGA